VLERTITGLGHPVGCDLYGTLSVGMYGYRYDYEYSYMRVSATARCMTHPANATSNVAPLGGRSFCPLTNQDLVAGAVLLQDIELNFKR
jgi:hypothetical protein